MRGCRRGGCGIASSARESTFFVEHLLLAALALRVLMNAFACALLVNTGRVSGHDRSLEMYCHQRKPCQTSHAARAGEPLAPLCSVVSQERARKSKIQIVLGPVSRASRARWPEFDQGASRLHPPGVSLHPRTEKSVLHSANCTTSPIID